MKADDILKETSAKLGTSTDDVYGSAKLGTNTDDDEASASDKDAGARAK